MGNNNDNDIEVIKTLPDYIYIIIPSEWINTYYAILVNLSEYGVDMLKTCEASCKEQNKKIIDCFNMFHAAIAAKHLGQDKQAQLLINYINAQLNVDSLKPLTDMMVYTSKEGTKAIYNTEFKEYHKVETCDCGPITDEYIEDVTDDGIINGSNKFKEEIDLCDCEEIEKDYIEDLTDDNIINNSNKQNKD